MRDLQDHILLDYKTYSDQEMLSRAKDFYQEMSERRTVREFSSEPLPPGLLENLILTAGTAPSGAHKQPWTFCVVTAPEIKAKIRKAAEDEEYENYHGRMGDRWMNDLKHLGTDHIKEFLDEAPALIVVFKRLFEENETGEKNNNYYVNESVGIAVGLLLAAIQRVGLVAVTHTPSPMNFLARVLERPSNERAFLLIPVGHPKKGTKVPDLERKILEDIMENYR
jgi:nitroreductase